MSNKQMTRLIEADAMILQRLTGKNTDVDMFCEACNKKAGVLLALGYNSLAWEYNELAFQTKDKQLLKRVEITQRMISTLMVANKKLREEAA